MTEAEITAAAAAKVAADKAAADKVAADAAAALKAASDKATADAAAAAIAAAAKIETDKIEADRVAAEKLALSKLTDKEAELLKEQMATKAKLKLANEAKAALEEKLKAFEGIDPAKAKEILAAATAAAEATAKAEKDKLAAAGDFDRLKAMMADEHKKETGVLTETVKTTKTALDMAMQTINDLTVGSSFNSSKFITDELVLTPRVAREVYGQNFEIENGNVVAYNKPKGAEGRTKLVNAAGEALGFEAAIAKLVDAAPDKDQLLKSKLKIGASSRTTNDTSVRTHQSSQSDGSELKGVARIQAALAKGGLKKAK